MNRLLAIFVLVAVDVLASGMPTIEVQAAPPSPREGFSCQEVKGKLLAVNAERVIVQNDQGPTTVRITPETRVRLGIQEADFAELRVGLAVTVIYLDQVSMKTAITIIVDAPIVANK